MAARRFAYGFFFNVFPLRVPDLSPLSTKFFIQTKPSAVVYNIEIWRVCRAFRSGDEVGKIPRFLARHSWVFFRFVSGCALQRKDPCWVLKPFSSPRKQFFRQNVAEAVSDLISLIFQQKPMMSVLWLNFSRNHQINCMSTNNSFLPACIFHIFSRKPRNFGGQGTEKTMEGKSANNPTCRYWVLPSHSFGNGGDIEWYPPSLFIRLLVNRRRSFSAPWSIVRE